jgi:conjugative relaxase-like TrwC/TraI family protein
VRLTVTPLGSNTGGPASAAAAAVAYLQGSPTTARQLLGPPGQGDMTAYYADSMEGPGRWVGHGARRLGLDGHVEPLDFARVLSGRDPHTGARLLGASGSADRTSLAVGTAAAIAEDGEPLYALNDVARLVGRSARQVAELVAAGDELVSDPPARPTWLRAEPTEACPGRGGRRVRASEILRFQALLEDGPSADAVAASGPPSDELGLAAAARLLGVDRSYLRRCCRTWLREHEQIGATEDGGATYARAWLECTRGTGGSGRLRVTRAALADFARRRRRATARIGFDLTLSTEKSVAIVTMLSEGAQAEKMLAALDAANTTALDYIERKAAFARHRGERVGTEGLVVASFLHGTSRALDPSPHRHNVVANAVTDRDGVGKALDARWLYREAAAAAALATAEMRWRVSRDVGVRWQRSKNGTWEVQGVPEATVAEFSTRRNEIDEAVADLEEQLGRSLTGTEIDVVVKTTRAAKTPTTRAALTEGWWKRATATGFDRAALQACFGRGGERRSRPTRIADLLFAYLAGPDGVTAEQGLFRRGDVIRAIADWSVDGADGEQLVVMPAAEVERWADRFLASDHTVLLSDPAAPTDDEVFTTVDLLAVQASIHAAFDRVSNGGRRFGRDQVEEALAVRQDLSSDQREWVTELVCDDHQFSCAIGHPGTGKTYALSAAVDVWSSAGLRVLGAAVKGDAARRLGRATGVPTETLAWYLAATTDPTRLVLDQRTVLVVDEATTIGDRDLGRLVTIAAQTGATVRLVGDPAQHGAVAAGGTFAALAARAGTPELTANRRLGDQVDLEVARAVRQGRIRDAFRTMEREERIEVAPDVRRLYSAMVLRWFVQRNRGHHHPMVDRRHRTRRILNELAHRVLQATGEVSRAGVQTSDGRQFCAGDEVVAGQPARDLHPAGHPQAYVRNGSRGVVVDVRTQPKPGYDTLVVDFEDLGRVELPRRFFDPATPAARRPVRSLDHAYAVTSYAAQGATFPTSTSAVGPGMTARELYVDITRGQGHNHVVAVRPDDRRDSAHLPRAPEHPLLDELARVGAPAGEPTGHTIAGDALDAALLGRGRSLAALAAERRRAERHADERASRRLAHAEARKANGVARAAVADPPAEILAVLPPRPSVPWLRSLWEETLGDMAVDRARRHGTLASDTGNIRDATPSRGAEATNHDTIRRRLETLDEALAMTSQRASASRAPSRPVQLID